MREPRRDPEFIFEPEFHTQGQKVVMGHTFNYGGERDGEAALDMLANDKHTAQFISAMLARHFVSDKPPQALVDRMAKDYESIWRGYSQRAQDHDLFAGILVEGNVSSKSENTV